MYPNRFLLLSLLLIASTLIAHSLLLYRPKPKPKLVCYAVPEDPNSRNAITTAAPDSSVDREDRSSEEAENNRSPTGGRRPRRSAEDLNTDDLIDIDIIGATLNGKHKEAIRQKLIRTCESLRIPVY